ncbi:MAG: hypothetical protein QOI38_3144 [Sphingomonadales bacterium]|jgi:hypothetical protein|nr:hypothetical protein [Sphingomonadales bacterium]
MTILARLRSALSEIVRGFCILNRIQFDAPWRTGPARRC